MSAEPRPRRRPPLRSSVLPGRWKLRERRRGHGDVCQGRVSSAAPEGVATLADFPQTLRRLLEGLREPVPRSRRRRGKRYAPAYGPLRDAIPRVVGHFLKCGILDYGFCRIRPVPRSSRAGGSEGGCPECHDEWLLGYSCRAKCLCPSCGKKRQLEFGELLEQGAHRGLFDRGEGERERAFPGPDGIKQHRAFFRREPVYERRRDAV